MTMEQNAQPIRVAQMMTDMNYGGVEMVVMNYYRHMDRSRVQFDFFALEGSTLPQREEIERLGGRVYVVPKYTHLTQYEREIGRLFRQNGYQIVHSHMNTLSVLSLWGAKRAGVPNRIAHNHSTVGRGEGAKNVMKYLLRPFAAVYPTRLCACSRTAGSWLYGEKPFRVFNNAIELDRFTYDAAKRKAVRQELGLGGELVLGCRTVLLCQKSRISAGCNGGGLQATAGCRFTADRRRGKRGRCPPESGGAGAAKECPLSGPTERSRKVLSGHGCLCFALAV